MYDSFLVDDKVTTVDVSPVFDVYSKVIIHIDDDTQVVAGDDTGLTLEIDNPFGNQEMADRILASLAGFQYRPYKASGALLDPSAEIGDAIETATSYGGIYTQSRNFGRLMKADVSAPCDEEIDHEIPYQSPTERKFKRQVSDVRASLILTSNMIQAEVAELKATGDEMASRLTQTADALTAEVTRATRAEGNLTANLSVQATEISAKVASSGGNSSFGWTLNSTSHSWTSNNTEVMRISASGLMVKGEVQATSGKIGGFTIGASAIYNNLSTFGGTQTNGVYLGTDGIQLGQNFKVTSSGNVTASSMTLKGTLTFLNADGTTAGTMSAANLRTGALQAYNNYGNWNNTYTSCSPGGYIYGGAGGGYSFNNATTTSGQYPSFFRAGTVNVPSSLSIGNGFYFRNSQINKGSMLVKDGDGNTQTIRFLSW